MLTVAVATDMENKPIYRLIKDFHDLSAEQGGMTIVGESYTKTGIADLLRGNYWALRKDGCKVELSFIRLKADFEKGLREYAEHPNSSPDPSWSDVP